jgi:hypothetical protein
LNLNSEKFGAIVWPCLSKPSEPIL